jgi:hypothetical protein
MTIAAAQTVRPNTRDDRDICDPLSFFSWRDAKPFSLSKPLGRGKEEEERRKAEVGRGKAASRRRKPPDNVESPEGGGGSGGRKKRIEPEALSPRLGDAAHPLG